MISGNDFSANLGRYQPAVESAMELACQQRLLERIWERDYTIWNPDPAEISNRLGWLDCPEQMQAEVPGLQSLAQELRQAGFSQALLLGMGGSSLAPDVLSRTLGAQGGLLKLSILDSTDPATVQALSEHLDPQKTVYLVSTKSGGTVETLSFFKYFYNQCVKSLGPTRAGAHFVAITDPGSSLADLAIQFQFRQTWLNDPNIGGRYSALSFFGLLPGALMGLDLSMLLGRAAAEAQASQASPHSPAGACRALWLGTILGQLSNLGRDKLTLVTSPSICSFGDWVEQLVAESTGKHGKGILPVVGEPLGDPQVYGDDRLFVYLRLDAEPIYDGQLLALQASGHPVVTLRMTDVYDLGRQFFLWEMATGIAGAMLQINPFNQPDVEAAKQLTRTMVAAYQTQGSLPDLPAKLESQGIALYGDFQAESLAEAWDRFLSETRPGGYIAIQAYLQPSAECDAALLELRTRLREVTHLAVTSGYGPRYLHSTGQLHKGDAGQGAFLQLVSSHEPDVPIPAEAGQDGSVISFGVLKAAQALGDYQALVKKGRKVVRFQLPGDYLVGLSRLTRAIENR